MKTKLISLSLLLLVITSQAKAQTWEFVGLDSMIIYSLEVRADTIWAGTYDNSINAKSGLYKSIDQGQTWVKLDSSLGNKAVTTFSIDKGNRSKIFIIKGYDQAGYFFKTNDNGLSWDSIGTPGYAPVKDFIISPIDPNEYYIITHTQGFPWPIVDLFYKSTDSGNTWEYKCCQSTPIHGLLLTFAIDHPNPDKLYISGYSNQEFFKGSTDRGDSWQDLSYPQLSNVFVDRFIPDRIYLFGYQQQIFSNDGGVTWQNMIGEYTPDAHFISFHQDSKTSVIYAWFNEGLYYSDNDSIYWKLIPGSEVLPVYYSGNMRNIATDNENNLIYVGTASGIYRIDFITSVNDSNTELSSEKFYLDQNFPNPFNPATSISYQIPVMSFVSLKVYDILGKEIRTLANEEKPAGQYNVEFDASSLPSGIYFYRIQAGNFVDTKKMILIK